LSRYYANENQILLADLAGPELTPSELSEDQRRALWDDNLHFKPAGYDLFGEIIFKSIEPYLASKLQASEN
jgi:lysophospholipase L1-like esterase